MSKERRKKELEEEIKRLQKRLNILEENELDEKEEDEEEKQEERGHRYGRANIRPPLPPLPPRPLQDRRNHKRREKRRRDDPIADEFMKDFDPFKERREEASRASGKSSEGERKKIEEEAYRIKEERKRIKEELKRMRSDLREREKEFVDMQRELQRQERIIREKEREFRTKGRAYAYDIDSDIEGLTGDLQLRLGDYTRSVLASVGESLKTAIEAAIRGAVEAGKGLDQVGVELGELGKELKDKLIFKEDMKFGPTIPEERMEEFYEKGAEIVASIGDPNRLRVLKELEKGPKYQKELSDITNLRGGTFKHHMDKLIAEEVKFVTQEVVRGRYLLTTRGREALKLAEILFIRYLEGESSIRSMEVKKSKDGEDIIIIKGKDNNDDTKEFDVKIR